MTEQIPIYYTLDDDADIEAMARIVGLEEMLIAAYASTTVTQAGGYVPRLKMLSERARRIYRATLDDLPDYYQGTMADIMAEMDDGAASEREREQGRIAAAVKRAEVERAAAERAGKEAVARGERVLRSELADRRKYGFRLRGQD